MIISTDYGSRLTDDPNDIISSIVYHMRRSSEAWATRQQLRKQSFAPRLEDRYWSLTVIGIHIISIMSIIIIIVIAII